MKRYKIVIVIGILGLVAFGFTCLLSGGTSFDKDILSYTVDTKSQDIQFYWKDDSAKNFNSIMKLKTWLYRKHRKLVFATNGGMFKQDRSPQGLYIQHQQTLTLLDSSNGNGNFYLKPNGVFYLTKDRLPFICKTADFVNNGKVKFATQSGPMLVVDGNIHAALEQNSTNLNIRNGVGILPDNKIVFAMSMKQITFYKLAKYFRDLGCKNALYLDGFVSRTYLPEKGWTQTDGNFGVIIGVSIQQ